MVHLITSVYTPGGGHKRRKNVHTCASLSPHFTWLQHHLTTTSPPIRHLLLTRITNKDS